MKQIPFLCCNISAQKIIFAAVIMFVFQFLSPCKSLSQVRRDQTAPQNNTTQFPGANGSLNNTRLTYKIIPSVNKTWGYDIYAEGKLLVHQPSVPALAGNEGFKSKEAAGKVANKVIEKIRKGENPPSISIDDMKKLSVISAK